jgi:4-amino-4-deoxy-L-arabinose transferase-like glycosyltransferase
LWFATVASTLAFRPLLPVDETRYLSVAWEMWRTNDWLVPHLNGATYAHKPPVLFWLIAIVWWVVGVSEMAARLVSPLCGLGAIWMVWRLARLVWPDDRSSQRAAPLVFAGLGTVAVYGTLATFDLPLTFFCLIAVEGVLRAWRGRRWGWIVCGAALGIALLTKGPVALLHVLPVPLLAPLWMTPGPRGGWARWYLGLLGAVALGAAVGFGWAIPAALAGGDAYAGELLWGQTADRMVRSFAHRQPFWWYLPVLPAVLLPWILVPRLWRKLSLEPTQTDLMCLYWFVAPLIVFSAVSGKQAQYLLPELAPASLFIAKRIAGLRIAPIAAGVALLVVVANSAFIRAPRLARLDLAAPAAYLSQVEREGREIVHPPDYEGEFNFLSRLTRPIAILDGPETLAWARSHPRGLLFLTLDDQVVAAMPWRPEASFSYRTRKRIVMWSAPAVIESEGKVMGDRF